jgi:signal transduction histidine kinase
VLKPLRWLKQGVEQVARGELSYRVPVKRSDELRDLSVSFNTMTERLRHLIQSKEQLLLDVSHELRTPITRIKVALAMMTDSPDRENIEEDLKEIEGKISQLLETARSINIKASLKYTTCDLTELIRHTAKPFETGRPAIRIAPMPPVRMRIDAEKIAQTLKNIFESSQKYSADDADPIEVSVESKAQEVVITIQDHGIGIDQKDLDFIFEPFYRADKARSPHLEGYGLGLSLSKNIVEAHDGEIVIHSEIGHGTVVHVHLPLNRPAP